VTWFAAGCWAVLSCRTTLPSPQRLRSSSETFEPLEVYVKSFSGFAIGNTYLQQAADTTQVCATTRGRLAGGACLWQVATSSQCCTHAWRASNIGSCMYSLQSPASSRGWFGRWVCCCFTLGCQAAEHFSLCGLRRPHWLPTNRITAALPLHVQVHVFMFS